MSEPLSWSMRLALQWMREAAMRGSDPHGIVANTMDSPYQSSGQVWISIATGRALERRGLIRIEDEGDAYLTSDAP